MSFQINKSVALNEDVINAYFFTYPLTSCTTSIEELCIGINNTIKSLSDSYIWHKEEFKVHIPLTREDELPTHLKSSTCYGDNVEDEWFIVYLIFEISKLHKNLIIQLVDNDGDFLLIEAANFLPHWANPETTINRVYIYNQKIHLIPTSLLELKTTFKINDALQLLVKYEKQTRASNEINEAVMARICQYPHKMAENFHIAIVNLPVHVAALLKIKQSIISDIVNAYCAHDMIDAKSCRNIKYDNVVTVNVKFTKCLYAMLIHSKLLKNTGVKILESDKKSVIGLKLTCGYNIIMKNLLDDLFSTKHFHRFLNNLNRSGYFNQNIEHSKEYNRLLDKAKEYYLETECPETSLISKKISEVTDSEEFLVVKANLHTKNSDSNSNLIEDSDEWLNINPKTLDDFLDKHYNGQVQFKNNDVVTPELITSRLTHFLKESSDYEGIDTRNDTQPEDENIHFEADNFVQCLEKMMTLLSSGNNGSDTDSDTDNEYDINLTDNDETEMDMELANKLESRENPINPSKTVISNFTKGLKEECLSGPSGNLLKTIGISKNDVLDSDDDN